MEPVVVKHTSSTQNSRLLPTPPSADFLDRINRMFAQRTQGFDRGEARDILAWAIETFGNGLSIGTSFGASGIVLMDLALQLNHAVDIFYIDTVYFFPETYTLIGRLQAHYQRGFRVVKTNLTIAQQEKCYGPLL
jgi:phosphoadenosine phosphosulfate reductase